MAILSTAIAALVGAFAAYYGGWAERVSLWIIDLLLVIPAFLLIALVVGGGDGGSSTLAPGRAARRLRLDAAGARGAQPDDARSASASTCSRRASWACPGRGSSFRHILPNISSLLIIDATLNVSGAILAETSLAYFGFGVQPPGTSLGTLLGEGARQVNSFPWLFAGPAVTIVLLILGVNAIGDGLRDALDPGSDASGAL